MTITHMGVSEHVAQIKFTLLGPTLVYIALLIFAFTLLQPNFFLEIMAPNIYHVVFAMKENMQYASFPIQCCSEM